MLDKITLVLILLITSKLMQQKCVLLKLAHAKIWCNHKSQYALKHGTQWKNYLHDIIERLSNNSEAVW